MSKENNEFETFITGLGFQNLGDGRFSRGFGKSKMLAIFSHKKKNTDVKVGFLFNGKYVSGFKAAKISFEEFKTAYLDFAGKMDFE